MADNLLYIAICEDSEHDLSELRCILNQCSNDIKYDTFSSGEELLEAYSIGKYDLLLMDIYMKKLNGVETITRIRELDNEIPVAFITTSKEFALESYRLSAIGYIEKPYSKDNIDEVLRNALILKENSPGIIVHQNREDIHIPFNKIIYVEQHARQVTFHLNNGSNIEVYDRISNIISEFDEIQFHSPHKSFIVNLDYVLRIDNDMLCYVLKNNENIPIRRDNMKKAKEALKTFLFNETRGETL